MREVISEKLTRNSGYQAIFDGQIASREAYLSVQPGNFIPGAPIHLIQ